MAEVGEEQMDYREEVRKTAALPLDWKLLKDRTVVISGATGMVGSYLIDVLMEKNRADQLNCQVAALGRSEEKARKRFERFWGQPEFRFLCCDINRELKLGLEHTDYVIHLASNTHPVAYATDPIGTVTANIIGTNQLLGLAAETGCRRFVFASSVEIYGENRGDTDKFAEDYLGYIDCNTLRAGYPESKRAGEALCQAYKKQKGLDVVIPRLSRTFGPTMLMSDTKAISQFIKKGLAGEDIVLKSEGNQLYSYSYVADAVSGLLFCMLKGESGEAYNIASENCNVTLKELASMIAGWAGTKVVFELPDATEQAGYSKATKAVLDGTKLESLGWKADYSMAEGLQAALEILKGTGIA